MLFIRALLEVGHLLPQQPQLGGHVHHLLSEVGEAALLVSVGVCALLLQLPDPGLAHHFLHLPEPLKKRESLELSIFQYCKRKRVVGKREIEKGIDI